MQVLVAPTRQEVDRAHSEGHWLEIGVSSLRNFGYLSRYKTFLWLLFSLSSVPLHLLFNGCVLESKASNGYHVLMASDGFLNGIRWALPPVTEEDAKVAHDLDFNQSVITISDIQRSATQYANNNWESIDFENCMRRYNDETKIIYDYRHVIMVVRYLNGTPTDGWTREQVVQYHTGYDEDTQIVQDTTRFDDKDLINSLWHHDLCLHYDSVMGLNETSWGPWGPFATSYFNTLDGEVTFSRSDPFRPSGFKVDHCLSEKFQAPCRLSIANRLLLIVCVMCSVKCLLCIFTLATTGKGSDNPFITPGDAIASFIARPGHDTRGMCTLGSEDVKLRPWGGLHATHTYTNCEESSSWPGRLKRTAANGIPRVIWWLTFLLIGSSLCLGAGLFISAAISQPLNESRFQHHPANNAIKANWSWHVSFIGLTMISNSPQLLLSVCYMVLNGIITRMVVEFEWSRYSTTSRSLRVTNPTGQQRSTYRLQLPYRWSIPIITLSALLHWIYSNCVYVSYYDYYKPNYPYNIIATSYGLQYSSVALLIALSVSVLATFVSLLLSKIRLPGNMVLGGSNSKVISAACHCIPASAITTTKLPVVTIEVMAVVDQDAIRENLSTSYNCFSHGSTEKTEAEKLQAMATKNLRWGEVSDGSDSNTVGHLAFGTEEQVMTEPVDGRMYR
ncbi:hypothetical protein F66182_3477 [Fusarium sp. NRRL 66182]|nr:hypothetical protein F66182_3477 [Fusarium sp. NRRL 66182]